MQCLITNLRSFFCRHNALRAPVLQACKISGTIVLRTFYGQHDLLRGHGALPLGGTLVRPLLLVLNVVYLHHPVKVAVLGPVRHPTPHFPPGEPPGLGVVGRPGEKT